MKLLQKYLTIIVLCGAIAFLPKKGTSQHRAKEAKLKANLAQATLPDTNRFRALDDLIWYYRNNNFDQAIRYAKEALQLASGIDYPKGVAIAYIRLGLIYQNKDMYKRALYYCQKALEEEEQNAHKYGISRAKNEIGNIYIHTKKYKQAIGYFEDCIRILESIGRHSKIPSKKLNLAICYKNLGNFKKSIELYLDVVKFCQQKNKKNNQLGKAYLGLGVLYQRTCNFKVAHEYLLKALGIFEKRNNKKSLAKVNHELGLLYFELKGYRMSETYYKKSLELKRELGSTQNIQTTLNNLGQVYFENAELDKARSFFRQSLDIAKQKQDSLTVAMVYNNIGLLYQRAKDYKQAIGYYDKSLAFLDSSLERYNQRNTLQNLSYAYARLGKYEQAFRYFRQYRQMQDSLETNFRKAMELKDAYEKEKQAKSLLQKDQKIKNEKLIHLQKFSFQQTIINYSLSIGLLLLLLVIGAIIKSYREGKNLKKKQEKIDNLLNEQGVIAMSNMLEGQEKERNRIAQDLHDSLGSTLSVVKMKFDALSQSYFQPEVKQTSQYIQLYQLLDDAVEEVRKVAHDIYSGALRKFGLLWMLNDLKEKIESTNKLEISLIDVGFDNRRLPASYEPQIYKIVQELISNVLKHSGASMLEIQLYWREGGLHISAEDNGKGFNPDKLPKGSGIGLSGMKERVKRLMGEMTIDSNEGMGTITLIDLPLENKAL